MNKNQKKTFIFKYMFPLACFLIFTPSIKADIFLGIERILEEPDFFSLIAKKKIGLVSHYAAINKEKKSSFDIFLENKDIQVTKLFSPEHGFFGSVHVDEQLLLHSITKEIPTYCVEGLKTVLPDDAFLDIDVLVFDIQDIGVSSYTFISVLFFFIEKAVEKNIPLIVLDRPNPIGGLIIDGPMPEKLNLIQTKYYIPLCHGMTIGELALLFKGEYFTTCDLTVVPMKGWSRQMTFQDTGLKWLPTSPQIPEASTPFFYATTGIIGLCSFTNIGIGYTLPFKIVGAPWIKGEFLAKILEEQKLPGVSFIPFCYKPFFGKYVQENCSGVLIVIDNPSIFLPIETQFTIIGVLKNLYPKEFNKALELMLKINFKKESFNKLVGEEEILKIIEKEKHIIWPLREKCRKGRQLFGKTRIKYLLSHYTQ